jgi:hypothetical protein
MTTAVAAVAPTGTWWSTWSKASSVNYRTVKCPHNDGTEGVRTGANRALAGS